MNTFIFPDIAFFMQKLGKFFLFMKHAVHCYCLQSIHPRHQNIRTFYKLTTYYSMVNLLPNKLIVTHLGPDKCINTYNYIYNIYTQVYIFMQIVPFCNHFIDSKNFYILTIMYVNSILPSFQIFSFSIVTLLVFVYLDTWWF